MKKQSLDEKSGSNEKFLFHGTGGDKLNDINKKGLNRSYAGNTNGNILIKFFLLVCQNGIMNHNYSAWGLTFSNQNEGLFAYDFW